MNKIFKKFLIDKLFYKIDTKKINGKANDFPTEPSSTYCIPLLTSSTANHGFARYAKEEQCKTILQNCISIAANGDSGTTFYQPFRFAVLQDAYAINTIDMPLNHEVGIYLAAVINKVLRSKYSWNYRANWNKVKNEYISLPIKTDINGNAYIDKKAKYSNEGFVPDFEYMQERVKELEQERVKELEQERVKELDAYLKVTGLNDYELTEDDRELLRISGLGEYKGSDVKAYKNFALYKLFASSNGDVDLQKKDINGLGDWVVSSGVENRGFIGKTDAKAKTFNGNTITIDMFGNAFYRKDKYKMVTHARVFSLSPLFKELDELNAQFIVASLKSLKTIYSYSNMCSWNKIKNTTISLPIKTDDSKAPIIDSSRKYNDDGYIPDWEFMSRYVKAIEKEVIADAVKKKDEIIEKTKEIVNKD